MQKLIFLIFSIFTICIKAQTSIYHPFPDSNAVWCCESGNSNGCCGCVNFQSHSTYQISGQTLIGGILYNRLLHYEITTDQCTADTLIDTTTYYIRQDTALKKVWMYDSSINGDTILFDFDLHVGDTLDASKEYWTHYFNSSNYWIVISIDSIIINGQYRKRFNYEMPNNPGCTSSMIEGIGPIHGIFYQPPTCFEYGAYLDVFIQDNLVLICQTIDTSFYIYYSCHNFFVDINEFETKDQFIISPNPFHLYANLKVNKKFENSEMRIYNIFGAQVEKKTIHGESVIINRDGLRDGIYFFQIRNDEGQIISGKFIIQ